MLDLFQEYVSNRQYSEALLVGQNMFNKHNDDILVFQAYFDLVLSLGNGSNKNSEEERLHYLQQATLLLTYFSENVTMSKKMVNQIQEFQSQLFEAEEKLQFERELQLKQQMTAVEEENKELLLLIQKLIKEISSSNSSEQLEKFAGQIAALDSKMNHDFMNQEQNTAYELLSKKCASVLEQRVNFLEHQRNTQYNMKAVEAYERVFQVFKTGMIANGDWMKEFFQYDASRLFNETLVYYNHVFSYILNQLDDDGKFLMTQCAIKMERKK